MGEEAGGSLRRNILQQQKSNSLFLPNVIHRNFYTVENLMIK